MWRLVSTTQGFIDPFLISWWGINDTLKETLGHYRKHNQCLTSSEGVRWLRHSEFSQRNRQWGTKDQFWSQSICYHVSLLIFIIIIIIKSIMMDI